MKRLSILILALAAVACSNKENIDIVPTPAKLDSKGTSNCYIVRTPGWYDFSATVRGNGTAASGLDYSMAIDPKGVKVVWQSEQFISEPSLENGRIDFRAAKIENTGANAIIAALDSEGTVLWSWHIWFTSLDPETVNLGATEYGYQAPGNLGLLYQWGRKDPFPNAPIVSGGDTGTLPSVVVDSDGKPVSITNSPWTSRENNNFDYSVANPTVVLSNYASYNTTRDWLETSVDDLWGAKSGKKTFCDPCPAGYRVPSGDVYKDLTRTGGYSWASVSDDGTISFVDMGGDAAVKIADINASGTIDTNDWTNGWTFIFKNNVTQFFPAACRYDGSYAMLMGSKVGLWGSYWTRDPEEGTTGFANAMAFQYEGASITLSPKAAGSRADAYSIRCVKE